MRRRSDLSLAMFMTGFMAFVVLSFWAREGLAFTFFDGNFELKGFVRNITSVRTEEPNGGLGGDQFKKYDVDLMRTSLQVEGSYTITPEFRFYGRWRGSYDGTFDLKNSQTFPKDVVDQNQLENEFRELYVDIRKGPLFLRLGKQQIVWGESDGLRLADIINPLDLRAHYLLESWEDIRIGLPAIRSIYTVNPKLDLELVWVPVSFEPTKWAGHGMYWEIPGLGTGGVPEQTVDRSLRNGSVGGKVRSIIGSGLEVSVYDYYHRDEIPHFDLTSTGLSLAHPYMNSIGGTFNTNVETLKTIFRGEAVYNIGEGQLDFTKPDWISKKNTVSLMLGVDRNTYLPINSESSLLSFQVFYKKVLNTDSTTRTFGDPNNTVPEETVITGFINTSYPHLVPNGVLTPALLVAYDVSGAWWVNPKLSLKYGDNWTFAIASNLFTGHNNTRGFFNPVNDRDEVYVDIKYSFQ
jgi:hypothetical protein